MIKIKKIFVSTILLLSISQTFPYAQESLINNEVLSSEEVDSYDVDESRTTTLPEVIVTGTTETPDSYSVAEATTATKTSIPLLETPQSIQVINRQVIDDQGAAKLEDVLTNVAGVVPGGYYADWDYYRIRGYDSAFTTHIDGLLNGGGMNEEMFGLERVEVLKGPSAALYGHSPLGGMVNLISKRPKPESFADAQFTTGSYEFYEPAVDVGGSLTKEQNVYIRVNALYRENDSFVDYTHRTRTYVAPSLTWEISPATELTILTRFQEDDANLAFALPAQGTVLPNINGELPINRFVGEPDLPNTVVESSQQLGYELKHQIDDVFSIRQNLRGTFFDTDWELLYPDSLDPDERTLWRTPYQLDSDQQELRADTFLQAEFETGTVEHTMIGGISYDYFKQKYRFREIDYADFPGSYLPIDIFDPVYSRPTPIFLPAQNFVDGNQTTGLYIQEHAKLFDRLTVTAGGRQDYTTASSMDENNDSKTKQDDDAFTPRVGATYELIHGLTVYGNYAESFQPQNGYLTVDGAPVVPETGEQWEAGLKKELLDGRLTSTLAFYDLTRQNVATDDPNNPGFSVVTGEQQSRGVEVDAALQLTPGWNVTGAYTYTDAEITEDNVFPVGDRPINVPQKAMSAWTSYFFQGGPLEGFGLGIGARHYSNQAGDLPNTFVLPAYTIVDAGIFYRRKDGFRAQVNIDNVLDERHFVGSTDVVYVQPGPPITLRAMVGWSF